MKRLAFLVLAFGAILIAALSLQNLAKATSHVPMTEAHIERIRANCVEAQSVLRRLHASDGLLRVNRGQLYELISTKLMAPMNSRVALNRLDGLGMVSITAEYERQLDAFRLRYKEYEESMSATLEIDCTNQPVAFYDKVSETREKRQKVNDATNVLHEAIGEYRQAFEEFTKTVDAEGNAK